MSEHKSTWCPGCGNFPILKAAKKVIRETLKLDTKSFAMVSGIGQAAKFPHYFGDCNIFNGLHGRALPAATGVKLGNHKLKVIVFSGDGDLLAEGGNHFIHAVRRNIDITCFLHNNQVYGLTKGQASPTADKGYLTSIQYDGVVSEPFYPLKVALALGVGFAARTFSGNPEHMEKIMEEAINYKGFSLVDILQPCVTFNKKNTYKWYKEKSKIVDVADTSDLNKAMIQAGEWGDEIPLGILYKKERPSYTEYQHPLKGDTLVNNGLNEKNIEEICSEIWQET